MVLYLRQHRQRRYNVILWRVHVTFIPLGYPNSLTPFHSKRVFHGNLIPPTTLKDTEVSIQSARKFYPILTKFGLSQQIFIEVSKIKFHRNPSIGSRAGICGETDRQKDMKKLTGFVAAMGTQITNIPPLSSDVHCRNFRPTVRQLFMLGN